MSPAIRLTRAIIDTVDEIGRVIDDEQIDCGFVKGGVIRLGANAGATRAPTREAELFESCGFGDELVDARRGRGGRRLAAPDTLGGLHYRPCARVHPAGSCMGWRPRSNAWAA